MIKLKEGWCIDTDKYQYILHKEKGCDKKGNQLYDLETYHGSLEECIKWLIKAKQKDAVYENNFTLDMALKELSNIKDEVHSWFKDSEEV